MRQSRLAIAFAALATLIGTLVGTTSVVSAEVVEIETLVISGVVDGPLSGGVPKAIEVTAVTDIADLSAFGVGSATNGEGTDGEEFTFPADALAAGESVCVASESRR